MVKKVIILFLLIVIISAVSQNISYGFDEIIHFGEDFINAGNSNNAINETALKETSDYIYNMLFAIAVVIAIAIGAVIGVQFIMGSVDEKAKVKETLVPYIVGVFVVFASFTIWKIAIELGNKVEETVYTEPPTYTLISPDGKFVYTMK